MAMTQAFNYGTSDVSKLQNSQTVHMCKLCSFIYVCCYQTVSVSDMCGWQLNTR